MITYRQVIEDDIPALFEIRVATWGNDRGAEEMAALGINPDSVLSRLRHDHAGWIALFEDKPVGFAMANRANGELWVIAVLPEWEGHGIGRELMRQAEAWLFSHAWREIWLTTHVDESSRSVGFYRRLGWQDWRIEGDRYMRKANPRSVINLEEHTVSCRSTGYTRLVRLQRGPASEPHRLCLFLDGEHYWRDMDAVPVLTDLCRTGKIPGMTIAFVGHVSGAARLNDYTCNERYGRFIGETVTAWVRKEIPGIDEGSHIIGGLSLSGLMATYLTLQYPKKFALCLSQSGAHWWKYDWFAKTVRRWGRPTARFWLSVGDRETEENVTHPGLGLFQEISQVAGVEKAVTVLKEMGASVHYNRYTGGHSIEHWREELGEALVWLLTERPAEETHVRPGGFDRVE